MSIHRNCYACGRRRQLAGACPCGAPEIEPPAVHPLPRLVANLSGQQTDRVELKRESVQLDAEYARNKAARLALSLSPAEREKFAALIELVAETAISSAEHYPRLTLDELAWNRLLGYLDCSSVSDKLQQAARDREQEGK